MTGSRALKSSPVASAASAGLRYVSDRLPGIRREIGPGGFKYIDTNGKRIRSATELARIRALAVPAGMERRLDLRAFTRASASHGA
jgi:DNA topoisomerase IB